MKVRALAAAALVATFGIAAVACSGNDSSSTTTTTTATTTSGDQSFQVDTPDGQASLSLDGTLPPNWPTGFPVPTGAEPAGSGSLGGTDSTRLIAVYTTSQAASDAFAFYTGSTGLNPSDASKAGAGSSFLGSVKVSGTYTGSVTVVGRGSSTYIVIDLEGSGSSGGTTTSTPTSTTAAGEPAATTPG